MRKEIILAIILGGALGLLIAFGVWRANSAINNENVSQEQGNVSPTEEPTNPITDFKVNISEPEDSDVITQSPVNLSGLTKENALIIISGESEDYLIYTDKEEFTQKIDLTAGINQILVKGFLDGSSSESDFTIVFSSEFEELLISNDEENKEEETSTAEGETIRQKVKEKIDAIRRNPKAYIGTLTDKTGDTFQIKEIDGEIQLASITDDVSYVKLNSSSTNIKFSDIAIGDFVSALGFTNGNKVLETKRVIISDPIEENPRTIVLGKIKAIDGKNISISDENENNYDLVFPKSWKGPEISELEEGDQVITIYKLIEGKNTIRTIERVDNIKE